MPDKNIYKNIYINSNIKTNSQRHPKRALWFFLALTVVAVVASELPNEEFLEFLGQFETDEGEWIDPVDLELMEQMEQMEQMGETMDVGADDRSGYPVERLNPESMILEEE